MSRMYGDLTPFPHDIDFVALLRDGVRCAVQLVGAQCLIGAVQRRRQKSRDTVQRQQLQLAGLLEALNSAAEEVSGGVDAESNNRARVAADKIVIAGQRLVDSAACQLCSDYSQIVKGTEPDEQLARKMMSQAVATFFDVHTPPDSQLNIQWQADADGYRGELWLETRIGLTAHFELAPPFAAAGARHRRVDDFASNVVMHFPQPALYRGSEPAMERVRLDQYCILEMQTGPEHGIVELRRHMDQGSRVRLHWLGSGEIIATLWQKDTEFQWTLCGEDTANLSGLWQRLLTESLSLADRREQLLLAQFDGVSVENLDHPEILAERIVGELAPLAVEIGKRALVSGQYALRGLGEAEVIHGTCLPEEDLLQSIRTLPTSHRAIFQPLQLNGETAGQQRANSEPPPRRARNETGTVRRVTLPPAALLPTSLPPPATLPPPYGPMVDPQEVEEIECEEIDAA